MDAVPITTQGMGPHAGAWGPGNQERGPIN